jgi:hypothetical protein
VIRHNLIMLNRDAQVWGWFDVNDQRHWPASTSPSAEATDAQAGTNGAKEPKDLSLQTLRLKFENNVYYASPNQGWFNWGVTWKPHKKYRNVSEFQTALGLDTGSQVFNPEFANPPALDFRLPTESMERLRAKYPQGLVPGVRLGINPPL